MPKDVLFELSVIISGALLGVSIVIGISWLIQQIPKPPKHVPTTLLTITHDNHTFIINRNHSYFLHHPDCLCQESSNDATTTNR